MTFGDRLHTAMNHMGWGPKDLERLSGVADSTISALIRRGSDLSKYKEDLILPFPVNRISHTWLRVGSGAMIPSLTTTAAGEEPLQATHVRVRSVARMAADGAFESASACPGHVIVHTDDADTYALQVKGDALAPVVRDGWLLVVEPGTPPTPGEYVLLRKRDGSRLFMELLLVRPDAIAVMPVTGGKRTTIDRASLHASTGIEAVVALLPPSRWRPD